MQLTSVLIAAAVAAAPALADSLPHPSVPSLDVPACPKKAEIQYNKSVPNLTAFPLTKVALCYDDFNVHLHFTALNESYFFYNSSYTTNGQIYLYEVMEAFIYHGTEDPSQYFEFEVAPNNVTFNAFIYNPSKVRAPGAPFDGGYVREPIVDGILANTTMDKPNHKWYSSVQIPLAFFNVNNGTAKGTKWRMNFFRTVVNPKTPTVQQLGAWSPPTDHPSFHESPFFGRVYFV